MPPGVDADVDVRPRTVGLSPVGGRPWGLTLSADGRRLFVANGLSNEVSVIDTRTRRVTGSGA